jgi:heme o synthase
MVGLLRASHPEPGGAVTVAAGLLAVAVGHGLWGALIVTASVATSQLAVGWHNDWLDAARDRAVGRADKPIATGAVARRTVGVGALVATAVTVPIALLTGPRAGFASALGLISALLYNWPLKFTALSAVPYVVSFAALPSFVVLALPGAPTPPTWLILAGGLLGGGAHFANVLPDLDDDARTGIRGLPHRLGATGSRLSAAGLLLAATLALAVGPPGPPAWTGIAAIIFAVVVLPLGWYASTRASSETRRATPVFRAVIAVALVDVILLLVSGRMV